MIYTITTDQLMKDYSKLSKKEIDNTNYIIISSRIKITKERDNVLSASHLFINSGELKGVGHDTETDSVITKKRFKFFLLKNHKTLGLIVSMLECDIAAGENSLLICSPKEMECGYMQAISDVIYELFHYRISEYPNEDMYDPEDVIKRLLYYKKQVKKLRFKTMSDGEKLRYVQKLSKKELKKALRKHNEDYDGLDRKEMERLLLEVM